MWFNLIAVGGIVFWSLVALELILLTWAVEEEYGQLSLFSIVIFLGLIHLFGDASFFAYLKGNLSGVLRYALIYVCLGVGWSVAKFYFYNSKLKRKVLLIKEKYRKTLSANEESCNKHWKGYLSDRLTYAEFEELQFDKYTSKILFWLTYWPVSMFWTMLNDPISRLGVWCYEVFLISIFKKIHSVTVGNAMKL